MALNVCLANVGLFAIRWRRCATTRFGRDAASLRLVKERSLPGGGGVPCLMACIILPAVLGDMYEDCRRRWKSKGSGIADGCDSTLGPGLSECHNDWTVMVDVCMLNMISFSLNSNLYVQGKRTIGSRVGNQNQSISPIDQVSTCEDQYCTSVQTWRLQYRLHTSKYSCASSIYANNALMLFLRDKVRTEAICRGSLV